MMNRNTFFQISTFALILIFTACGGVASNPTAPNFNPPGGGQQGGAGAPGEEGGLPGGLAGQLSGGGAADTGDQIIQGTFEVLWPQGLESMEAGQLITAGQFFKSAYAQDPQSADAALAYAIVDLMRDFRRYSVFLHPGVDKLFTNTPLIGHAEVFPNPFLTEDSYFLRLTALGNRASNLVPTVVYPILAAIDTDRTFSPQMYLEIINMAGGGAPVQVGDTPIGIPSQDSGGNTSEVPDEEPNAMPPDHVMPDDGSGRERMGMSVPPPAKQGEEFDEDGTLIIKEDDPYGTIDTGTIPPVDYGDQRPIAEALPEREEALSESEWEGLIREYRDSASRDGMDMFLSGIFYENLSRLHEDILEHIDNLESVRSIIETEGYALSLPFNVLDGTQKITMMFDLDDFTLILDHFKLLDAMLNYVEVYNHDVEFRMPTEDVEDTDNDTILRPDEYLPPSPFGTITEDDQDILEGYLQDFVTSVSILANDLRPLLERAQEVQPGDPITKELFYLSSFDRNFVMIEEWTDLLQDIADRSSSGTTIKLASADGVTEIVAVYDALFLSPITDIRDPLPSFAISSRTVITDQEGNWSSDPTFGGFFPNGLTDEGTYLTSGRLTTVVFNEELGKAVGSKVIMGNGNAEVGETGVANLNNVNVNELIGSPYTVQSESGEETGSGLMRTLSEIIPLFDINQLGLLFGISPHTSGVGNGPEETYGEGVIFDESGLIPGYSDGSDGTPGESAGDSDGNGDDGESDDGNEEEEPPKVAPPPISPGLG